MVGGSGGVSLVGMWEHMSLNFNPWQSCFTLKEKQKIGRLILIPHMNLSFITNLRLLWAFTPLLLPPPTFQHSNLHPLSTPTNPSNKLSGCIKVSVYVCVWVQRGVKVFYKVTLISESHCHFKIVSHQIAIDWSHHSTSMSGFASITYAQPSLLASLSCCPFTPIACAKHDDLHLHKVSVGRLDWSTNHPLFIGRWSTNTHVRRDNNKRRNKDGQRCGVATEKGLLFALECAVCVCDSILRDLAFGAIWVLFLTNRGKIRVLNGKQHWKRDK